MQFIRVTDQRYEVTDIAQSFLEQHADTELAIIAVVGAYRKGKSYLLNRIVDDTAFKTSSTTNAQTRGLWLCPKLLTGTTNQKILVVDSEGLGSVDAKAQHDANIFSLAILMASTVLFNSMGAITSDCLQNLQAAGKIATLIRGHASFASSLPRLLWVLRDFSLQMVDGDNQPLTPGGYIDYSLQQLDSKLSQSISELFPERQGIALPRPTTNDEDLATMTNLTPAFEEGIGRVQTQVQRTALKKVGPQTVTGSLLLAMMQAFCQAINEHAVPQLSTVWEAVVEKRWFQAQQQHEHKARQQIQHTEQLPLRPSLYVHPAFRDIAWQTWQALAADALEPPQLEQFVAWRQRVQQWQDEAELQNSQRYHDTLTTMATQLEGDLAASLSALVQQYRLPSELEMFGHVLLAKNQSISSQQQQQLEKLIEDNQGLKDQHQQTLQRLHNCQGQLQTSENQLSELRQEQLVAVDQKRSAEEELQQVQAEFASAQEALDAAVRQGLEFKKQQQSNEFELRAVVDENTELKQAMMTTQKSMASLKYQLVELTRQNKEQGQQLRKTSQAQAQVERLEKELEAVKQQHRDGDNRKRELETQVRVLEGRERQLEEHIRKKPRLTGPDLALTTEIKWLREQRGQDQVTINDQKNEIRQLRMEQRRRDMQQINGSLMGNSALSFMPHNSE